MIPTVLARQLRETVLDYLGTTFSLADPALADALLAHLASARGLFRGPFLELRLPYRLASGDPSVFLDHAPGSMIEQDRDPDARPKPGDADAKKKRPAKRWETREYLRPASSALREFAPFNTFYAEGRHLEITDLDLGTAERPAVAPWRFCPACDHAERAVTAPTSAECPRCGAAGWDDAGQRHELVAFRLARSFTAQHESLTVDASDERVEARYRVADLIDF